MKIHVLKIVNEWLVLLIQMFYSKNIVIFLPVIHSVSIASLCDMRPRGHLLSQFTVADQGFTRGRGANPKGGGSNLLF